MTYRWNRSTDEALAIVASGWKHEEEHAIFNAAHQHVRNVARLAYSLERMKIPCPTCGRTDAAPGQGEKK